MAVWVLSSFADCDTTFFQSSFLESFTDALKLRSSHATTGIVISAENCTLKETANSSVAFSPSVRVASEERVAVSVTG